MSHEQKDIGKLGPIGIVSEGLKAYRAHAKVYFLIQLTLIAPAVIVMSGVDYYLILNGILPDPIRRSPGGAHVGHRLFSFGSIGLAEPYLDIFLQLLSSTPINHFVNLFYLLAASLAQATCLYSVGLHYAGQPIAYFDVVRAAVPRLSSRIAVTNAWSTTIACLISLINTVFLMILSLLKSADEPMRQVAIIIATMVVSLLLIFFGIYVRIIFMVAPGVSALGEEYGWGAVRKSMKLLKVKMWISFFVQLLFILPTVIDLGLGFALLSQMKKEELSAASVVLCLLLWAVYVAWTTLIAQVKYLCSGVLYVSCKAYHEDPLADPLLQSQQANGGYVAVGDGNA